MCKSFNTYYFDNLFIILKNKRLEKQWKAASVMAQTLLNENNWSKATYCYLLSTFIFEDNRGIATDEVIKLYK